MAVTLLTFVAEIGGVALSLELVTSVNYLLLVPWWVASSGLVLWRARFSLMENVFGLLGLALIIYVVALWQLGPDWSGLVEQGHGRQAARRVVDHVRLLRRGALRRGDDAVRGLLLLLRRGRGAVGAEETSRHAANVFIGFPLGGLISLAIAGCTWTVFGPAGHRGRHARSGRPAGRGGLGKIGSRSRSSGFFAATFGAACETGLSAGYSISQYFGWQWGKYVKPAKAARFHLVTLVLDHRRDRVAAHGCRPHQGHRVLVVFSAVALPLTYFPILVVANDRDYMGDHVNGRVANGIGTPWTRSSSCSTTRSSTHRTQWWPMSTTSS
jgi:Mn2+/Fe2+ NRAMP family transporter